MADVELVIRISEDDYNDIMTDKNLSPRNLNSLEKIIASGMALPKGHGAIVDLKQVIRVEIEDSTGKKMVWNNNLKINDTTWRMVVPVIIEEDKEE